MLGTFPDPAGQENLQAIAVTEPQTLGEALSVQQESEPTTRDSSVSELLVAYQGVLDTVADLPLVPLVLRKHGGWLHYLPRYRWLLRYFVVRHISHTLISLSRRYSARASLGWATDGEQRDRQALREFQQSLPPTRSGIDLVLLLVATALVFRKISHWVVSIAATNTTGLGKIEEEAEGIIKSLGSAFTVNFASANELLDALADSGPLALGVTTAGFGLSLYVVLRPLLPVFRLKRMLFNLAPEPSERHRSAVAKWSVSQATGIYECERRAFAELGGRAPREFPFDLAVSALPLALLLAFATMRLRDNLAYPEMRIFAISMEAIVLIVAVARIGWMYLTWRRRQMGSGGPYMPYEVGIHGRAAIATVSNPAGIRLLVFVLVFGAIAPSVDDGDPTTPPAPIWPSVLGGYVTALLTFLVISLPWWYRVRRELRDLDRAHDVPKPRRKPLWVLFMVTVGWLFLPFIATYRRCRAIWRAQERAGLSQTLRFPWLVSLGVVLAPVLFAYMQHELNKLWMAVGEPLDPWPGQANSSAGTLPWVKESTRQPRWRQSLEMPSRPTERHH